MNWELLTFRNILVIAVFAVIAFVAFQHFYKKGAANE